MSETNRIAIVITYLSQVAIYRCFERRHNFLHSLTPGDMRVRTEVPYDDLGADLVSEARRSGQV
jgi:hypothetical protein